MKTNDSTCWEKKIELVVSAYKSLARVCDAAIKAGCMDVNGPLHESIWRSFDKMLEAIDCAGWISWFIYDNECGKKHLMAGLSRKPRKIKTVRDLACLLEKEYKSKDADQA